MAPTIRVEMTAESDGAQYCCFITDANGDMGSTRCATVKLDVRDWTMEYTETHLCPTGQKLRLALAL